jgi:hypothetical protein
MPPWHFAVGCVEATRARTRAAHGNCRAKRGVVVDLGASFDGRPLCLYEVKTLQPLPTRTRTRTRRPAPQQPLTSARYGVRHRQPHASTMDYRAKLVPVERERDADRLDRAPHPHRPESKKGEKGQPVRRRLRELGGVEAVVVGAFAEHSADVHELVDELAAAGAHKAAQKYLMPAAIEPRVCTGATKALLHLHAAARSVWSISMEGALGAPTPQAGLHRSARAQARRRRCSRSNTPTSDVQSAEELMAHHGSGVHTEAALQLLANYCKHRCWAPPCVR